MAAPCEILANHFPQIDDEVSSYVNGILDCGIEDFESTDDLYEAIGELLLETQEEKTEEDIREICDRLLAVMKQNDNCSQGRRILNAPVHLGQLAAEKSKDDEHTSSIWMARCKNKTYVDKKKLEKAEAKLKQKLEKREGAPASKPVEYVADTASASQQASRKDARMEQSGGKSMDIHIEDFDVSYGQKTLLINANLHVVAGRRYGLCGRNGIGKTTLLRMMSSRDLRVPSHITILHVEQEVVGDDTIALQSVLECDEARNRLLTEEKDLSARLSSISPTSGDGDQTLQARLNEVYHELEAIDSDRAPAKAGMILAGLGFSPQMQAMTTRQFSGGWRMRLALARALFSKPDLLLLDEPTNMLDMKAIIWLENYLQQWPTTILCVSHDRQFLNTIVTDVLHQHSNQIDSYHGDYDMFVKTREEKLKNQQREYEAQKQYRQHIQVFIDRFRYNANRASQVQSKLKLLEKLPELIPIEKESSVVLKFLEAEYLSPPILMLDEMSFHYASENPIFTKVEACATMESRICIVGENGAGKTTLLKLLMGDLRPTSGVRHAHRNLRIGYFSQHHVDQLEMNVNSVELLAARFPGKTSEYYRGQLGSFGISGDLSLRPVVSLSGGQKSRVAFAQMSMTNPNFFILDEPTNHLDVETIEALGQALKKFKGGLILVSHDERLIRMVCSELWVVRNNKIDSLEGGIDEYKKIVQEELAAQS